jgi:hypothetical protein
MAAQKWVLDATTGADGPVDLTAEELAELAARRARWAHEEAWGFRLVAPGILTVDPEREVRAN